MHIFIVITYLSNPKCIAISLILLNVNSLERQRILFTDYPSDHSFQNDLFTTYGHVNYKYFSFMFKNCLCLISPINL